MESSLRSSPFAPRASVPPPTVVLLSATDVSYPPSCFTALVSQQDIILPPHVEFRPCGWTACARCIEPSLEIMPIVQRTREAQSVEANIPGEPIAQDVPETAIPRPKEANKGIFSVLMARCNWSTMDSDKLSVRVYTDVTAKHCLTRLVCRNI